VHVRAEFTWVLPPVGLRYTNSWAIPAVHALAILQALISGLVPVFARETDKRAACRLLVFRPFNGEVLVGTVHKSTPQGLWISVGFFQDIMVPPQFMPDGSEWDEAVRRGSLQPRARNSAQPAPPASRLSRFRQCLSQPTPPIPHSQHVLHGD
jgi:hypothetical protein